MTRNATQWLAALAATILPVVAVAQTGPMTNRRADAIALIPDATGGVAVHAAWSVARGVASSGTDLSTDVEMLLNGTSVTTIPASNPADGSHLTTFPSVVMSAGDEITVVLHAAATAAPETETSDDWRVTHFHGEATYWNRSILGMSVIPAQNPPPGAPPGSLFDIWVEVAAEARGPESLLNIDIGIELEAAGDPHYGWIELTVEYDPATDPTSCFGGGCGDTCGYWNGLPYHCDPGFFGCSCTNSWYIEFPNVPGESGGSFAIGTLPPPPPPPLDVFLTPTPGALPELPGFPEDDEETRPVPVECRGDSTGDGLVNFDDLNEVLSNWNTNVLPGTDGDVTYDGFVDFDDLNLVLSLWGTNCFPV